MMLVVRLIGRWPGSISFARSSRVLIPNRWVSGRVMELTRYHVHLMHIAFADARRHATGMNLPIT